MLFSRNILLLLFLYFIQGLPYGFQASFLPSFLRQQGVSLTTVGLFKLLLAPWLCKALWAPLVDRFGTKHKWLLWSIGGLILTCLTGCFISPHDTVPLSVVLFMLNVFAATQDITVDAIAVAILDAEELGKGNTAQVVGYKIGSIFGGGVLVWFIDILGWSGLFAALTILYIEAWMFVFVSPRLRDFDKKMSRIASEKLKHSEGFYWKDSSVFTGDSSESSIFPEQSLKWLNKSKNVEALDSDGNSSNDEGLISASHLHAQRIHRAKLKAQKAHVSANNGLDTCEVDNIITTRVSDDLVSKSITQDGIESKVKDCNVHLNKEDSVNSEQENDLFGNLRKRHIAQNPLSTSELEQIEDETDGGVVLIEDKVNLDKNKVECVKENIQPNNEDDSPKPGLSRSNSDDYGADAEDNENSDNFDGIESDVLEEEENGSSVIVDEDDEYEEGLEVLMFLRKLLKVPGTRWMIVMVLAYKIGEQGCIGMLPQFLIDQKIHLSDVTFWKGLMGQCVGIIGSLIGGWIVSHYNIPLYLLLQQLCLLRLLPAGGLLGVISCWSWHLLPPIILYYAAVPLLCLMLLLGGAITTVTFTFMMQCSKMAPSDIQATHYTLLATLEVFGKLGFMSIAGFLTDVLGYPVMFVGFALSTSLILPWFDKCPDDLKLVSQLLIEQEETIKNDDLGIPVDEEKEKIL